MVGIEEINKDQGTKIELTEIQEALKPAGFLTKKENIMTVAKELENKEALGLSMEKSLTTAVDTILLKTTFENDDIQMLNLRNILLGEKEITKKIELKTKMETIVKAVSTKVNMLIADNKAVNGTYNGNHYTADDIKTIQLWANIAFDEDLIIDGKRNNLFYSSLNTEYEQLTNIYIYRQELKTRSEMMADRKTLEKKEFNTLLDVPNLEALLTSLGDKNIQNKVFGQFLEFFWDIREAGMGFENIIGSESLSIILLYMINKEKYTDVSIDEYFKNIETSLQESEVIGQSQDYLINTDNVSIKNADDLTITTAIVQGSAVKSVIENNIETPTKTGKELGLTKLTEENVVYKKVTTEETTGWIPESSLTKKLDILEANATLKTEIIAAGYTTMGEYYAARYKSEKDKIIVANTANIEVNTRLWNAKEIIRMENELLVIEADLATLESTLSDASEKQKTSKTWTDVDIKNLNKIAFTDNRLNTDIKKEEKILKMMEIYKFKPDYENYPLKICLELKSAFDENYIKIFLEKNTGYGLTYKDYQSQTKAYDAKKNIELKKWDPVNDMVSQLDAKKDGIDTKIKIDRPTLEEFKTNCYVEYQKTLNGAPGMYKEVSMVPYDIGKLILPGSTEAIYIKTKGFEDSLPAEVSGKKIIVRENMTKKSGLMSGLPSVNDIKFGYAYRDKDKNIIVEDERQIQVKIISLSEQSYAANALNLANLDTYDYDMKSILHTFETANTEMSPIMDGWDKFHSKEGINDTEVSSFYDKFSSFQTYSMPLLEGKVAGWKISLAELQAMRASTGGIKNTSEENIDKMIGAFQDMINFYEVKNDTSKARELFKNFPQVGANNTNRLAFKTWMNNNGIATLCAIAVAVLAVIAIAPSGGSSLGGASLLISAMITTGTGMAGYRLGTWINEGIQNTYNPIYVNGAKVEYINETDVEKYIAGSMTAKDFRSNIGTEFLMGTISTFGFMAAGTIVGQALNKAGFNAGWLKPTTRLGKFKDGASKLIGAESTIVNTAAHSFGKRFMTEFAEETFEEVTENTSQAVHPVLGGFMTFINCLNGHPDGFAKRHNLSGGLSTIDGNAIRTQMCHNSENIQEIIDFYINTQGYTAIKNAAGELLYLTKPMDATNIVKNKAGKTLLDTHIIELIPSKASEFLNNKASFFAEYEATINHDAVTDEVKMDQKNFNAFKIAAESQGIGTIQTDTDGTIKLITVKGTIVIKIVSETTLTKKKSTNTTNISENQNIIPIKTEVDVNTQVTTESTIEEIIQEQSIFNEETDIDEMTDQEQMTFVDKIKIKIFDLALSLSGKSESDVIAEMGTYVVSNVKHFLHEAKMVFGTQLVDVYKSYIQMKNNLGKPGDIQFQKLFQVKAKERGINLTKLIGVGALAKLGIDPHLFFWAGHLVTDQLQKNIPFFDKLFSTSFTTMNDLYSRKKGKNTMYNPQTVVKNSFLESDVRRQKMANELGLDINDAKNTPLLDALQKAHETGQEGPGKNPEYSPGVYNYTATQIRQKMEILKPFIDNGSLTSDQVRTLFEHGYLGKNAVKIDMNESTGDIQPSLVNKELEFQKEKETLNTKNELLITQEKWSADAKILSDVEIKAEYNITKEILENNVEQIKKLNELFENEGLYIYKSNILEVIETCKGQKMLFNELCNKITISYDELISLSSSFENCTYFKENLAYVNAEQITKDQLAKFDLEKNSYDGKKISTACKLKSLEPTEGDWIVYDKNGNIYVQKNNEFIKLYSSVKNTSGKFVRNIELSLLIKEGKNEYGEVVTDPSLRTTKIEKINNAMKDIRESIKNPFLADMLESYLFDISHPMNINSYMINPKTRPDLIASFNKIFTVNGISADMIDFSDFMDDFTSNAKTWAEGLDSDFRAEKTGFGTEDKTALKKNLLEEFKDDTDKQNLFKIGQEINPGEQIDETKISKNEFIEQVLDMSNNKELLTNYCKELENGLNDLNGVLNGIRESVVASKNDAYPAVNGRTKNTPEKLLDKIYRMRIDKDARIDRQQYSMGDMPDAVGGRITVENMEQLVSVMEKIETSFPEKGWEITEKEDFYFGKKVTKSYRVITYTVISPKGVACEVQLTTFDASITADINHNICYKSLNPSLTQDHYNVAEWLQYGVAKYEQEAIMEQYALQEMEQ